jgi:hypothetical protein
MPRTKVLKRSYAADDYPQHPSSSTNPSDHESNQKSQSKTHKKTRIPISPRVRQVQAKSTHYPKDSPPARVRPHLNKPSSQQATADAFGDAGSTEIWMEEEFLADSFASEEEHVLSGSSEEYEKSGPTHSEPRLEKRSQPKTTTQIEKRNVQHAANPEHIPSAITMIAGMIWHAIEEQNWDRLDRLVESMRQHKFRFDDPALKQSNAAQQIIQSAPMTLLAASEDTSVIDKGRTWLLVLDLLELGCDWNATDQNGIRVIDHLRSNANKHLIESVIRMRPELKYLLLKS